MIRMDRCALLLLAATALAGCLVNEAGRIPCNDNANCPAEFPSCSPASFCVAAAAPAKIEVTSGASQTAVAGSAPALPLVARVTDANGSPVQGFTVSWSVNSGGGTVSTSSAATGPDGKTTVTVTLGKTAGANVFTASGSGLSNSPASFTLQGIAGAPVNFLLVSGNNQVGVSSTALSAALAVRLTDANNNGVPNAGVTWSAAVGGGSLEVPSTSTDAGGFARTIALLGAAGGSNTFRATAGVPGLSPIDFTALGANTLLRFSGDNQTGVPAAALLSPIGVKVTDAAGNGIPGFPVSWAVATGGGSVSSAGGLSDANGLSFTTPTLGAAAGSTNTFTATAAGLGGSPMTFTATSAAQLVLVSGDLQSGSVGSALAAPLVVQVTDAASNPVKGFTVTWAALTGNGSVASATTTTDQNGMAQTIATLGAAAGTNIFKATAAGLPGSPINFTAFSGSSISQSSGDQQTGIAGSSLAKPLVVLVKDASNNPISGFTVNWAATSGGGSVGAASSVTNASGLASVTAKLGSPGGANSYTASANGVNSVVFTATAATSISASAGMNQTGVAGATLSTPLTVLVTDNASNPVAGITVTWAAASGGGSVGAASSVTGLNGVASVSATLGVAGGANTFTATALGLTGSPVTFSATAAKTIALSSGNNQAGVAGQQLGKPLVVLVTGGTSPVAGITVNWAVGAGNGSVSAASSVTDASGLASIDATLGTAGPNNTFTATVSTLTGSPVTFSATGNVTSLAISSGNAQTGVVGTALASPLQVIVKDNAANPVANVTVSWAATGGGAGAAVSAARSSTSASGIATVNATLGATGGANTFTASVAGLPTVTFTATAAKTIAIKSGNDQAGKSGTGLPNPLVVLVTDGSANPVSGIGVSWAAAGGGGTATATGAATDNTGSASATATLGTSGGSNTFTATVAGLTPMVFTALGATTVAIDPTTNGQSGAPGSQLTKPLTVIVSDSSGGAVAGFPVVWAVVAGGGSVSPVNTKSNAAGQAQTTATLGTFLTNTYSATAPGFAALTFTATATGGTPVPPPPPAPFGATATVVQGGAQAGTVFIAGGSSTADATGSIAQTTSLYDPATGRTTAGPALRSARAFHTATAIGNGQILLAGGRSPAADAALFERCSLGANSSCESIGAAIASPRCNAAAALLTASPARVLVAGGNDCAGGPASSGWTLWDARHPDSALQSAAVSAMSDARVQLTATSIADGMVLLAGGGTASADLFTLDASGVAALTPLGPMLAARSGHTATVLAAGTGACRGACVLLAGGAAARSATWELFDAATRAFGRPAPAAEMLTSRAGHAAALLADGRVLIAGGSNGGSALVSTEVFDARALRFSSGIPLDAARVSPAAVYAFAQDLLVIVGGGAAATEAIPPP